METGKYRGSARNSVVRGKLWCLIISIIIITIIHISNKGKDAVVLRMELRLVSLSQAIEPIGYTTESACDAWPVRYQTYGYRPSHKASSPFGRYQFILLGEQRHMCVNNLPRVVREAEQPEVEPGCKSDALTTTPPRHTDLEYKIFFCNSSKL